MVGKLTGILLSASKYISKADFQFEENFQYYCFLESWENNNQVDSLSVSYQIVPKYRLAVSIMLLNKSLHIVVEHLLQSSNRTDNS